MSVWLRPARDSDAVLFYRLRLDLPETQGRPPASWQEHVDFFARHLSRDARWYVAEQDGFAHPVGVLRLDVDGQELTWVSIIVDERARGCGVGLAMLSAAQLRAAAAEVFWARIHVSNAASLSVFAKAGFILYPDGAHPWQSWRWQRGGGR